MPVDAGGGLDLRAVCFSGVSRAGGKRFAVGAILRRLPCNRLGLPKPQLAPTERRRLQFRAGDAIAQCMDKETVIRTLRAHEAELRAEGISHVYLFGSVARGEADEKSDVDLFFDHTNPNFGFLDLMRVKERFAEILGGKVDAMMRESVHRRIRTRVEAEAIPVF